MKQETELRNSTNPMIAEIKKFASSGLMRFMLLIMSTYLLISLAALFVPAEVTSDNTAVNAAYQKILECMASPLWLNLLSIGSYLAICAGIWLFHLSASNKSISGYEVTGLRVSRFASIAYLVIELVSTIWMSVRFASLSETDFDLAALFEELGLSGAADLDLGDSDMMLTILKAGMSIGVLMGLALIALVFAFVIRTFHTMEKTSLSGTVTGRASVFIAVLMILSAVSNLLNLASGAYSTGILGFVVLLLGIAESILIALCIFKYNAVITPFRYAGNLTGGGNTGNYTMPGNWQRGDYTPGVPFQTPPASPEKPKEPEEGSDKDKDKDDNQ